MANLADKSIRHACWRGGFADDTSLYFGDSNDVGFQWDGTNLILTAAADDSLIEIGDSATTQVSFDLKWYANEASGASYLYADASANLIYTTGVDLQFKDNDYLVLGTGAGAAGDVNLVWDATDLHMNAAANNTVFNIGDGTTSFDIKTFGSAAANYMLWDASDNSLEFTGAAKIDFAGIAASASTVGSLVTTGSTWVDHTAAGGTAFKLLCSTSATTGDYATLRICARSDAASSGGIVAGNFSASANIAEYGNLYAVQGYAQPGENAQTGADNTICGLYSCTDLTATGSSGRDWSLWVDTHMAGSAAASSYLARFSHNGTVAADGLMTIYGGGNLPLFMNIEDATPGFVTAGAGTYSTADGYLAIAINGSAYRIPYFADVD